jgi:hypothetical protein
MLSLLLSQHCAIGEEVAARFSMRVTFGDGWSWFLEFLPRKQASCLTEQQTCRTAPVSVACLGCDHSLKLLSTSSCCFVVHALMNDGGHGARPPLLPLLHWSF